MKKVCCIVFLWTACLLHGPLEACAQVSLSFNPSAAAGPIDGIVKIDVVATADVGADNAIGALNVLFTWDPTRLDFLGIDDSNAGYDWFSEGFFTDPDGINADLADGDALYTALARFDGPPAVATPEPGLIVTSLCFKITNGGPDIDVECLESLGEFGQTRVLAFSPPNQDITADIDCLTTIRVLCDGGVGDIDTNGAVEPADVPTMVDVLLGFDTDPAHVAAADLNCDGAANGLDIQPFLDLLLFLSG